MGRRSSYANAEIETTAIAEPLPLRLGGFIGMGCSRKFDPTNGTATSVNGPRLNFLPEELDVGGDWSWKPRRDKSAGEDFKTFLGVPKGMPELLGRARELEGERGAARYGNPVLPIRKYPRIIPGANGGSFDTLAGTHVGQ